MADIDTLKGALIKAHNAGDTQAANLFAQKIKAMQAGQQPEAVQPQERTAQQIQVSQTKRIDELPEVGTGGLLGGEDKLKAAAITPALLTTTDANEFADILKSNFPNVGIAYTPEGRVIARNNKTGATVEINKPGISRLDVLQTLGVMAAYAPTSAATSVPMAALKAGLTESAIQGVQSASGGEFNPEDVALSSTIGAGGKVAENVLSSGVRAARGAIPEEQAAIIRAGQEANIPVMTTDVIPPETLAGKLSRSTGETIPVAGTGGARASQQRGRVELTEEFADGVTPRFSEVVESLSKKTNRVQKAAGSRLNSISTRMDEAGQIQTNSAIRSIDEEIAKLSAPGRVLDEQTVNVLNKYKTALEEGQSFSSLDTLRSDFRESVKGDRMTLPTRSNAAMERIYNGMTADLKQSIDGTLGAKETARWVQAKGFYGKELNMLKKSRLKAVLDKGDVTPENVKNIIFSQKPSEMKSLYASLDTNGRAATRASIINEVVERASKKGGGLTPNSLATELNKANPQISVFFKGEDRKQLIGLKNFLNSTRRAQETAVATPTGQQLAGIITGGGVVANPGVTLPVLATIGGLARVYESAPVRNALLKLASLPKGTDKYDKAVIAATKAFATAAQTANKDNK